MKAWQFIGVGQPLTLQDVDEPVPGPYDVVIDNKAAGLCHTDVAILDGPQAWLVPSLPQTLGHEFAGIVSDIGHLVTTVAVGDRVSCSMAVDTPGIGCDGGYAPKVRIPERLCVPIPDGLSFADAAAGSDAGATAYTSVHDAAQIQPGEKVGIIGIGGVGSFGARVAVLAGAEVYVAEPKKTLHDEALSWGVTACVTDTSDLAPFDLDAIIDYAGYGTTTAKAVEVVKARGRVVLVGQGIDTTTLNTTLLISKYLKVIGSGIDSDKGPVTNVYRLMLAGQLEPLITRITFDQIGEGIERLRAGTVRGRQVAILD